MSKISGNSTQVYVIILLIAVTALLIFQTYQRDKRRDKVARDHSIEAAMSQFRSLAPNGSNDFGSVYANADTISFYRNDRLIGRSVTTTVE
jgi:hypothetical protein